MLTGDLVRARVRGATIAPSLVDPASARVLEAAEAVCAVYDGAREAGSSRGEVATTVDDLCADRRDHKMVRGLAKLLDDRSSWSIQAPVPPGELRAHVFHRAVERGPLDLEAGPFARPTAADVLGDVGAELGLDPEAVRAGLYADLKEAHRLDICDCPGPAWLVHRYNVALVQALLLRSTALQVDLVQPAASRMRQLLRAVKFHRLIHAAKRAGDVLTVRLDGPASLFRQNTRYGLQLANFFPALLLQEGAWQLEATVLWTRRRLAKTLSLSSTEGLRSHYRDVGGYVTREHAWFAERFAATPSDWSLAEGETPLDLGGRGVIFPDFTLRRDGRVAHLEIVGFWRRDDLVRKAKLLGEHGPGNLVLAVSRRLRGSQEALEGLDVPVVEFAEVVPVRKVLDAAERVAR